MANQNAEQNAPATADAGQQDDFNEASSAVAPDTDADDNGDDDFDAEDDGDAGNGASHVRETSSEGGQSFAPPRGQGELVEALTPLGDNSGEQKEVANGRPYEIVFIVRTTHGNDIEAITARANALIEGAEGAVDNVRTSDVRRFSYTIDKEVEGSYVVVNARFATGVVQELDRFFKLEEGVLRHLIVREDV